MFIDPSLAVGHVVDLRQTDPRHLPGTMGRLGPGPAPGPSPASRVVAFRDIQESPTQRFGEALMRAFDRVNQTQLDTRDLSRMMITDPDAVDIHEVTIAMAESNLALNMTKSIVDRALRAYQTITTLR